MQSFRVHLLDPTLTYQKVYILFNVIARGAPQVNADKNASSVKLYINTLAVLKTKRHISTTM